MKWLVFGSKGWIGQQVLDILARREGDSVVCPDVRADDEVAVEALLVSEAPDRVLSLIGRTHGPGYSTIDYLEQKGKLVENVRDNLYAPVSLALLCAKHQIHFTYLGTGCIFSYAEDTKSFSEDDRPNFFGSSYSTVKGFTDRLMHALPNVLNARIRMPITAEPHPRNFITKITSYKKICSIENSMTVLPELLPIMVDMAARRTCGTVNLTNPGVISHNEILEMYKEIVDPEFTWENFTLEEQRAVLLSDRSNNHLETSLLQFMYPDVKPIKESMRQVLQRYAEANHSRSPVVESRGNGH
jgi:3,5-epimerase/4-reductase